MIKTPNVRRKAAVVVFSYYPADPRVRREAEALVRVGISVDVICLRSDTQSPKEKINGVNLHRLPLQRTRGGKFRYFYEYALFIFLAFFQLSLNHLRNRYHLVHIHNMPDILVFTALVPRLTGSKVILDLHDPMPEVYMTKYSIKEPHLIIRLLIFLEKQCIRFANIVLTPNIAFRNLFINRSCPKEKIHIVMNSPDEAIFYPRNPSIDKKEAWDRNGFILMYHGTIVERNGLDIALKAISLLKKKIPNILFHVYGNGDYVDEFLTLVSQLELLNTVVYHGHVPHELIPIEISKCDLGLIPNKNTVFNDINLPTRIFEFLCIGKPVIAPRTKGISDYFNEESIYFHEPGSADNLAEVILKANRNPEKSQVILNKGIAVFHRHRWELQREYFLKLVRNLLGIHPC